VVIVFIDLNFFTLCKIYIFSKNKIYDFPTIKFIPCFLCIVIFLNVCTMPVYYCQGETMFNVLIQVGSTDLEYINTLLASGEFASDFYRVDSIYLEHLAHGNRQTIPNNKQHAIAFVDTLIEWREKNVITDSESLINQSRYVLKAVDQHGGDVASVKSFFNYCTSVCKLNAYDLFNEPKDVLLNDVVFDCICRRIITQMYLNPC
jgi:hypothetical protein